MLVRFAVIALLFSTVSVALLRADPAASSAPSKTAADNLAPGFLENAAMTEGTDKPDGWGLGSYKEGKIRLSRDTTVFKSAPAALCVETQDGPGTAFVFQRLADNTTKPLAVSCFVKTTGKFDNIQLAVQVFDDKWKQIAWFNVAMLQGADDWQAMSGTVTLPAGSANALLGISFKGDGKIWLDDVSVKSADKKAAEAAGPPEQPVVELPVVVPASDRNIHYVGRFDTSDPENPVCAWSNSAAVIRFNGTSLNALLKDTGSDRVQVVIDGQPTSIIVPRKGKTVYTVATGLAKAEHRVELIKCTEPMFGTLIFKGFQLEDGGRLLPVPEAAHRIEIIGDSVSCGYGNEAKSQSEHFSPTTENAYFTYGAITARAFGADYFCVAWSGKTVAFKNTMQELYDRTLPQDDKSKWAFARWAPEVVIVNLSANDFAGGIPDQKGWTEWYIAFVTLLRQYYPKAEIYVTTHPMLADKKQATVLEYLKTIVAARKDQGDSHIRIMELTTQEGKVGFGADWHPNTKQHAINAKTAIETLSRDLGWKPVAGLQSAP